MLKKIDIGMKLAVMQPYFFPYIGYFQLMNEVDEFVIYDNIQYTKKGWINRNRILINNRDSYLTLPLKKDSDYLDIKERYIAENWSIEKLKVLNKIVGAYKKSPNFDIVFPIIKKCLDYEETNLFKFILNSINVIREFCNIQTPLIVSSTIPIDQKLKSDKKVIAICKARKATIYINPIGGIQLYAKEDFKDAGLDLYFLKTKDIIYRQFANDFVPWLSIIDVMMFNAKDRIKEYLNSYYSLI